MDWPLASSQRACQRARSMGSRGPGGYPDGAAAALVFGELHDSIPMDRVRGISYEVFGEYAYLPDEGKAMTIGKVGEARWNYAVSKLAEEHFALSYYQRHGLPVVIVRPFNVYGPAQVGDSAMRTFVQRALRGEPLYVHGDGSQIRAWCYIDDMVDALVAILQREEAIGETFNIGNPATAISVYNLAKLVIRVVGSPSEVVLIPKDYADIALCVPSITRAMRLLGFLPKVDLEEGILRTAEFYRRML